MTTYYVDGAVGNDGNAGTSEGAGNAWATIDHAMNTVAATGDTVYVKASGTYSETPNIDTAATSLTSPMVFEGYTTTPGDGGRATISGTTNNLTTSLSSNVNYIFRNFTLNGASSHGVSMANADAILFENCQINNNGGIGVYADNNISFLNCEILNNTQDGVDVDSTAQAVGNIFGGNGHHQASAADWDLFAYNLVYGIPSGSYSAVDDAAGSYYINNTVDGENVAAVGLHLGVAGWCFNNIIYDCATAVSVNASFRPAFGFAGHNLLNSNTTDYSTAGVGRGRDDVTGAPSFTDEANDDYTLGSGSPAIDAGITPGGVT